LKVAPIELLGKTLTTVSELAQSLMYDFPKEGRGEAYQTALMTCLDVLEGGDSTAEEARASFIDAAHEVELMVLPEDGPDF
jgi:hypothetical protein